MIEKIKTLRISIDRNAQLVQQLPPENLGGGAIYLRSRQIDSCAKNLLYAKAWLGKLLGYMGNESPYKNDGKRSSINDIEPTDAKSDINPDADSIDYSQKNHIEKVDYLRQEIQQLIVKMQGMGIIWFSEEAYNSQNGREQEICRTNSYNYLCEARFDLGFELERIRESK